MYKNVTTADGKLEQHHTMGQSWYSSRSQQQVDGEGENSTDSHKKIPEFYEFVCQEKLSKLCETNSKTYA